MTAKEKKKIIAKARAFVREVRKRYCDPNGRLYYDLWGNKYYRKRDLLKAVIKEFTEDHLEEQARQGYG